MRTIAQRFRQLRAEVPPHVAIVAVSKFAPETAVREAFAAGAHDFGENYVQEAQRKFPLEGARLHFIGHVQTNKAKAIARACDLVQSVDRAAAAQALSKAASALEKVLPVLLQVNISPAERFGCPPEQAAKLAREIRALEALRLDGIMAIGPLTNDGRALAQAFEIAQRVWREVGGPVLSIGMSGDWEQAVEAGSTMIRAGSAIFGPRPAVRVSKGTAISS